MNRDRPFGYSAVVPSSNCPNATSCCRPFALPAKRPTVRNDGSESLGRSRFERARCVEEAVKTAKSLEFLDRAQKILDGLKRMRPEQIRQMRAVLALEFIDNDDSRNLLKQWAGGPQGALLTEQRQR